MTEVSKARNTEESEKEEEEGKGSGDVISFFLQTSLQRRIKGLRLKSDAIHGAEVCSGGSTTGYCFRTKGEEATRFSGPETAKSLEEDYIKGTSILSEIMHDRFDGDYRKRVKLVRCMERILKADSVYACVLLHYLNGLTGDLNINVAKSIVDFVHNNIALIIPNIMLAYSIKYLCMEKEKLLYVNNISNNRVDSDFSSDTTGGTDGHSLRGKYDNILSVSDAASDPDKSNCWWDSKLAKELALATDETLDSFFSLVRYISSVIETHGRGYYDFGKERGKPHESGSRPRINHFQVDNDRKVQVLYKKSLRVAYKMLRICMLDTKLIETTANFGAITQVKNRLNSECWDYPPNNLELSSGRQGDGKVLTLSYLNNSYVYVNSHDCLLPLEVFLCGKCVGVFEGVIKNISSSVDNSGRYFFPVIKEDSCLMVCYWIQFVSWLVSNQSAYLGRFMPIIKFVSAQLLQAGNPHLVSVKSNSQEECVVKERDGEHPDGDLALNSSTPDTDLDASKLDAVKFVFREELLRILGSHNNYNNIILLGEIRNLLNRFGKDGSLHELRREALNRFRPGSGSPANCSGGGLKASNKKDPSVRRGRRTDDKEDNLAEYPPIYMQKLRGKSTKYSYKRIKYDLENGFHKISPQSVVEGVSWLFSTNSYSNVIDMAINNFLNIKIPNNLLSVDNTGGSNGNAAIGKGRHGLNLMLNSNNVPWTNKFSPLMVEDSSSSVLDSHRGGQGGRHGSPAQGNSLNGDDNLCLNFQAGVSSSASSSVNLSRSKNLRPEDLGMFAFDNYKHGDFGAETNKLVDLLKPERRTCEDGKGEREDAAEFNGGGSCGASLEPKPFLVEDTVMNSIEVSDCKSLLNNVNGIKAIIFSQIITSVLVAPVVDVTPEGVYTVSRSLSCNNQLMNVLKHGQLILSSWELLLKRIRNSEKSGLEGDIELYGEEVSSVWRLLNERINAAFDITEYKYRLVIRAVLGSGREGGNANDLIDDESRKKLSDTLVDVLVKNLMSETKELLVSVLMISNIYDNEYLNVGDPSEDSYLYLDGVLYQNKVDLCGVKEIAQESFENGGDGESGVRVREISLVLLLWVFNYVLERRVKILHSLMFRSYYVESGYSTANGRTEFDYSRLFEWLHDVDLDTKTTETDCIDDRDSSVETRQDIVDTTSLSFPSTSRNFSGKEKGGRYNRLFCMCFRDFVNCFSEHKMKSEIFLTHLKSLVLNCPLIPIDFPKLLYGEWIFPGQHTPLRVESGGSKDPKGASGEASETDGIKRDFAVNILLSILNSSYPVEHLRKVAFYTLISAFLRNEIASRSHSGRSGSGCSLDKVRILNDSMDDDSGSMETEKRGGLTDTDGILFRQVFTVRQNLFAFMGEFFLSENAAPNRKINVYETEKTNKNFRKVFGLPSPNYMDSLACGALMESLISENDSNWRNTHVYGEKWPLFISLALITSLAPAEMEGPVFRVTQLLELNPFLKLVVKNLVRMYASEIGAKHGAAPDFEFEPSIFDGNVSDDCLRDLFSCTSVLFRYYCLKYPCLIHFVICLCHRTMKEAEGCESSEGTEGRLDRLNMLGRLYKELFKKIVSQFRQYYNEESGSVGRVMSEYVEIASIYRRDTSGNKHMLEFIYTVLSDVNLIRGAKEEFIEIIYEIFKETEDTMIIVPIIGHYELSRIKELLPVLVNKSDKSVIKECIRNILSIQNKNLISNERVISPSELLILLISYSYPNSEFNVDKKKTVDVIDSCFELTQCNPPLFESETIASVIEKLVQDNKSVFPRTLGRTLVLSILYIPSIRSFIATFVISSLIRNCSVWDDTLTWRGVKHCIQKLWSDYKNSIFQSLILLPQAEFKSVFNELIETNSDLRTDCLDIIKKMVSSVSFESIFLC